MRYLPVMRTAIFVAAVGLGSIAVAPGCVTNRCLVSYCEGPDCTCSVSSCGDGAAYDDRARSCRCLPGYALVNGHCLSPQVASSYCGPGYRFDDRGCVPAAQCRPGDELDRSTGMCIPHERVNQVASTLGVNVGPGQKLGCPPGQKLVLEGSDAACVPLAQTCARDEVFDGARCTKPAEGCPQGSAWDVAQGTCVAFALPAGPSEGAPAVDVAQWASSHYGRDGGEGAPAFCNAFANRPWSFGVTAGSSAVVRVVVSLAFPDGQIAKAAITTRTAFANSGAPVLAKGASDVDAAARSVFAPLGARAGRANRSAVTTTVKCTVVNAARPVAVPASGGL
jgi:hypothetical protein